ncbi:hypothetical protein [Streptomyces collinus]|uniref:Uncharacterized protein n=1 Tax=Streptomyces collinus (strain DSM 40733 / Tue 365) TaxID=1214242 RepID=S5VEU1_STRC3|nr:hypothetical protein [Streptomyces collinus]AGS69082.1 hypothetical protein B446_11300 [Streptomyces collinus Tu 365]UJA07720.1 hypothetical protein HGI10_16210 [Streptomyces collinus]UJA17414.1 hypothetical protein HGI09_47890 [Streptomyces collinus]
MTNLKVNSTAPADLEGGLATLRGDCARMAPHWAAPVHGVSRPVPPSLIHGVDVPARSARLLDAMSDYGD